MLTDREWDRKLHIRTTGREDEANPNYAPYEPTPYSVLRRLADSGHIRRKDHLLDYGCGKGRVAFFLASEVGCRVTGIEHSPRLIDMARENRRTSRLGDRVQLICARAEQYELRDESVFFFFNPFSEMIFESVLRRIARSNGGRVICYYPSEAYLRCLEALDACEQIDDIDCSDLFNGTDPRERIVVYRLRQM